MRRRDPGEGYTPFQRPVEAWRAMGAPAFMWDDAAALRMVRAVYPPGWRLDGFGPPGERHMVRRFRRDVVAEVLSRCGELTATEREKIRSWPLGYPVGKPPRLWLLSFDDVFAGRVGDDDAA